MDTIPSCRTKKKDRPADTSPAGAVQIISSLSRFIPFPNANETRDYNPSIRPVKEKTGKSPMGIALAGNPRRLIRYSIPHRSDSSLLLTA
jgi:hypothetical protein